MTEREKRIEIAVKNPEQIVESPEEIAARENMRALFVNSNSHLSHYAGLYEAGWKAAKAYYDVQD